MTAVSNCGHLEPRNGHCWMTEAEPPNHSAPGRLIAGALLPLGDAIQVGCSRWLPVFALAEQKKGFVLEYTVRPMVDPNP